MKKLLSKNFKIILIVFMLAAAAACMIACGVVSVPLSSLSYGADTLNIHVGEEMQLSYTKNPSNSTEKIVFSSDASDVAAVSSDGLVTGLSPGTAKITAAGAKGSVSDTIDVVVTTDTIISAEISTSSNRNQTYRVSGTASAVDIQLQINTSLDISSEFFVIEWYEYAGTDFLDVKNGLKDLPGAGDKKIEGRSSDKETFLPKWQAGFTQAVYAKVYYPSKEEEAIFSNLLIFGVYTEMEEVGISIPSSENGFSEKQDSDPAEIQYSAQRGSEVTLLLEWGATSNKDPEIRWTVSYKQTAAGSYRLESLSTSLNHHILSFAPSKNGYYEIKATADGKAADEAFYFSVVKADVKDVCLSAGTTSDALPLKEGMKMSFADIKKLYFLVDWNKVDSSDDPQDTMKYVEWRVNGTLYAGSSGADEENLTFDFLPSPTSVTDTYTVTVRVYDEKYVSDTYGEASFEVAFLEKYETVKSAKLSAAASPAVAIGPVTILPAAAIGDAAAVTLTASLNNVTGGVDKTSPFAKVEWYVNGTLASSGISREFVFSADAFGEYRIHACVDNVLSDIITVVVITPADYTNEVKQYIQTVFWMDNGYHNLYITSQEELNTLVRHIMTFRLSEMQVYFTDLSLTDSDNRSAAMKTSDFAGSWSMGADQVSVQNAHIVKMRLSSGPPTAPTEEPFPSATSQFKSPVSYTENPLSDRAVPVESAPYYPSERKVVDSNGLYYVLTLGFRPQFESNAAGESLNNLYLSALSVLKTIITDSMTDFEKVLAIYEWIVTEVEYDHVLAAETENLVAHPGFYLEGVFRDKLAVCDGKSKAFSALCGMEGLTSLRVTGEALSNGRYGNHAWNKILLKIDEDADGAQDWFVVDTTWGDQQIQSESGREFLTYTYFLLSDAEISTHRERSNYVYPKAVTSSDFAYYKTRSVNTTIGGFAKETTLYINKATDLSTVLVYLDKLEGSVCMEVYVYGQNAATILGTAKSAVAPLLTKQYDNAYYMKNATGYDIIMIVAK